MNNEQPNQKNYKSLRVWLKSIELCVMVYKKTKEFPNYEQFALCDQMRRSVVSVASNIAEGYGRESNKDINHFLTISNGSLFELETQIIISREIGYCSEEDCKTILSVINDIAKMLYSLKRSLKAKIEK